MGTHAIIKALEVWTLQNLLNFSILLGLLALLLVLIQEYYRSLEKLLSLRVTIELWRVLTVLLVDVLLTFTVLIGYIVLNPDIMADIKMAVPFQPLATVLFAVALVLRVFHQGQQPGHPNFLRALYCLATANLLNVIGFTFIMEAPGEEYLELHPSPFWEYVKAHFRSNASPHGLELAQWSFYVCFPVLLLVFLWAFYSSVSKLKAATKEAATETAETTRVTATTAMAGTIGTDTTATANATEEATTEESEREKQKGEQ